jgi:lipopolysaccharide/colanic/teichoic acid biosynthesis glycosyltransferase
MVLLPLYLAIGGLIFIVDGSPVHYLDVRVGGFGREFACLKFRSMPSPARDTHPSSLPDDALMARGSATARFEKAVADPRVLKTVPSVLRGRGAF